MFNINRKYILKKEKIDNRSHFGCYGFRNWLNIGWKEFANKCVLNCFFFTLFSNFLGIGFVLLVLLYSSVVKNCRVQHKTAKEFFIVLFFILTFVLHQIETWFSLCVLMLKIYIISALPFSLPYKLPWLWLV